MAFNNNEPRRANFRGGGRGRMARDNARNFQEQDDAERNVQLGAYQLDRAAQGIQRQANNDEAPQRAPRFSKDRETNAQPRKRHLGFKIFEDWSTYEPEKLLHTMTADETFVELLDGTEVKDEWIPSIVKNLSIALESTLSRQLLLNFLLRLSKSTFMRLVIPSFLAKLSFGANRSGKAEGCLCIKNLLATFRIMLRTVPNACEGILPIVATIEYVAKGPNSESLMCDESLCLLMEVEELLEGLQKKLREKNESGVKFTANELSKPPDDFREISIFPTSKDIYPEEEIFLRVNKRKGGYEDVNHYLDVQFRLMREDFVAPLRDGIKQYLEQQHLARGRLNDIRVYTDIHILYPVCANVKGITYRVRFNVERLKHVRWEVSRRLIYGSLVCLSKDNFETMLFASVSDRNVKGISNGELELQFEHNQEEVSGISSEETFIMAETTAYFEAYRHVLTGIQQMREENFQFQRYIVRTANDVSVPRYLERNRQENGVFDLRPLVDNETVLPAPPVRLRRPPLPDIKHDAESNSDDDEELVGEAQEPKYSEKAERLAKAVRIVDNGSWPDASVLHLDVSQYKAVRAALTREFAIIQGPPGTGKTYIGLKVVRALLHNSKAWCRDPVTTIIEHRPILLVCYTNHALDQFLEGVAKFTKKGIVRVGGRSQCEAMAPFLLRNLRNDMRHLREVPGEIHRGRVQAKQHLETIQKTIEEIGARLEAVERGIVHEDVLKDVIEEKHWDNLEIGFIEQRRVKALDEWNTVGLRQPKSMISEWLDVDTMLNEELMNAEERLLQQQYAAQQQHHGILMAGIEANMQQLGVEGEDEELLEIEDEIQREQENRLLDTEDDAKNVKKSKEKEKSDCNKYLALNIDDIDAESANVGLIPENDYAAEVFKPVKISRKKLKRKLKRLLQRADAMTSDEAAAVRDMWTLSVEDRWKLYRYWANSYRRELKGKVRDLERQYQAEAVVIQEILQREDLEIMRRAKVIGMTTTAAAKYRRVLMEARPKIIVVEEAAEVLESHVVTAITDSCEHLILIGDHMQLRPSPNVHKLAKKFNLELSLFERMVNNDMPCETLQEQHRMRPEISCHMLNIYPDLKNHKSVLQYENIKGVQSNVFFVNHAHLEQNDDETRSKSNDHEAQYIAALCKYLLLQGYKPTQITVLTPYTGQLMKLRRLMPKKTFEGIRVTAVDNFQGEENDIILLSLVRSNNEGKIGFLGEDNRVCVALSRAKKGFYVIGNLDFLEKHSDLWSKMKASLEKAGCYGTHLPLKCQNHPTDAGILAASAEDFQSAPEGGCLKPCVARLPCGHVCTLACHAYDREHKEFKCMKTCGKILCDSGHNCTKPCYIECGKCVTKVQKLIPKCKHIQDVPCWQPPSAFVCKEKCSYRLDCGHPCTNECGAEHTKKCLVKVPHTFDGCCHKGQVDCHEKLENPACQTRCTARLDCEHACLGTCGKCFRGFVHDECHAMCKKILVCGHACINSCANNCPPCGRMCETRCVHSKCPLFCGQPCNPCREPCEWRCEHFQCPKLCFEPCDRPRCNKPCRKRLPCQHQCIGLCGEPCPDKCRFCHAQEVQEIFFGTEEERDARFVQLEDCGHLIEVNGLDTWMDQNSGQISMKRCPKCKTVISRNLRYGAIIKGILADIELVKVKSAGDRKAVESSKEIVMTSLNKLITALVENEDLSLASKSSEFVESLTSQLEKSRMLTEVARLSHIIAFVSRLCATWKLLSKEKCTRPVEAADTRKVMEKLKVMFKWFVEHPPRLTVQQVKEIDRELKRLSLVGRLTVSKDKLFRIKKASDIPSDLDSAIKAVERYVHSDKPLTELQETEVAKTLEDMKKHIGGLGITDTEKEMIVKAMQLTQGHWFKCRNGHIYCIGDCGGAMQQSVCPECKAPIGGGSHTLLADNALAPEMDGARHAAWSEQANLVNYGNL